MFDVFRSEQRDADELRRERERDDRERFEPRFERTYCSQCGCEFGPGEHGYSHCEDHKLIEPAE